MLRILLFLGTNFAIITVLGVVMQLFGLDQYLTQNGYNLTGLLIMAAVFGMGGSFISLALSKTMAKRGMGARVIETPADATEQWLVSTVQRQAREAGIGMPEVAIFDSPQMNAFATGMSRNNALVAVSTGLMRNMERDQVEAVLGHEVSHVANGDMVTLALVQGVMNTFVIFLAHIIGRFVDKAIFKSENGHGPGFFIAYFGAQMLLGILASIIVMWFSRYREFRADSGGARLASRQKMISALERLKAGADQPQDLPDEFAAFGIRGGVRQGLQKLFMTHPPLEDRIAALRGT